MKALQLLLRAKRLFKHSSCDRLQRLISAGLRVQALRVPPMAIAAQEPTTFQFRVAALGR
jgi:hypothetical protein